MKKYKIPGTLWLIFGLAISIFSQIVKSKQDGNTAAMQLFFYIGLLFIVIGIFKIVIKLVLNPKKENYIDTNIPTESNEKFKIILCPKCKAKNYASFNYCRNCGTKLH